MMITRAVVEDLLPLYLAGEVSPETHAVVDAFLASDPELARVVKHAENLGQDVIPSRLEPRLEVAAFEGTRRELKRRSRYLGLALAFTLLPFSFAWESGKGVFFLFAGAPLAALPWLVGAAVWWALYHRQQRRLRTVGV